MYNLYNEELNDERHIYDMTLCHVIILKYINNRVMTIKCKIISILKHSYLYILGRDHKADLEARTF